MTDATCTIDNLFITTHHFNMQVSAAHHASLSHNCPDIISQHPSLAAPHHTTPQPEVLSGVQGQTTTIIILLLPLSHVPVRLEMAVVMPCFRMCNFILSTFHLSRTCFFFVFSVPAHRAGLFRAPSSPSLTATFNLQDP